jgi:hypothetical protein
MQESCVSAQNLSVLTDRDSSDYLRVITRAGAMHGSQSVVKEVGDVQFAPVVLQSTAPRHRLPLIPAAAIAEGDLLS